MSIKWSNSKSYLLKEASMLVLFSSFLRLEGLNIVFPAILVFRQIDQYSSPFEDLSLYKKSGFRRKSNLKFSVEYNLGTSRVSSLGGKITRPFQSSNIWPSQEAKKGLNLNKAFLIVFQSFAILRSLILQTNGVNRVNITHIFRNLALIKAQRRLII